MKKVIDFLKLVLTFPAIIIGIFYIFRLISFPVDESVIIGTVLLAIYLLITIFVKLSSNNRWLSLVLFIILLPIASLASFYIYWFITYTEEHGANNGALVLVIGLLLLATFPLIKIAKELSSKNSILHLLIFITTLPVLGLNILYFVNYYPTMEAKAEFRGFKYYIVSLYDTDYHPYVEFYKCPKWSLQCEGLYGSYSWQVPTHIIVDKTKGEVSIIESTTMTYTDGKNPRTYVRYTYAQLGNHLYFLSKDDHEVNDCTPGLCDIYTYALYECKLDYTSCNPLPIQYTEDYDVALALSTNEATNEINVHDNNDDILILTWGEHPRCYVEGCKILEKK